ncbi:putative metal-binding motif-containing protein [Pyxidicoccus trucidator]|uniref:putative metal-binding motif-containing protein n=1 Tax=Pyxidicoccus trucidator TaxID=2709662 RepID=UPI0013DB66A8|nr:putative metal-binding motif-containing protein [Pyxidicoccus trucidator]
MRRLLLPLWPLLLLTACQEKNELPDARQAAVRLEVDFTFKAGCISVEARDKDAQEDHSEVKPIEVLGREASDRKLVLSIFRRDDWGRTLEIITTAREQSCTGPVVASALRTVTLDTAGVQTVAVTLSAVDDDDDGFVHTAGDGTDCADNDAAVTQRRFYRDADGDSYGAGEPEVVCTAPAQHVARGGDCDDTTASRSPGVAELCDGIDNDCVGGVDNGLQLSDFYLDADRDGVGAGTVVRACLAPQNHVVSNNDCDDTDAARRPGLAETCDDKDNDCDGAADEGLVVSTYYRDADGDGFGRNSDSRQKCNQPDGYATAGGDCNDDASAVNPSAQETCNDVDDNCAGGVDEGFNKTWHRDADGDTFGVQAAPVLGCTQPAGYVAPTSTFDCNDSESAVNPGAMERCNDIDDNCAGGVDEPFTSGTTRKGAACGAPCTGIYVCNMAQSATTCNAPAATNYYTDADGDGDGAITATAQAVCPTQPVPPNTAPRNTDCNDTDRHNKGNGTEVCDQRDNDCNSSADEGNVCMGAGWRELTDPAVIGRDWNTVAINKDSTTGYPVWIAGGGGALARRSSAGGTFTSFDGTCGMTTWNAAWVHSDGSVFLAGDAGRVAQHDGTTCTQQRPLTDVTSNATGIVGFEGGGTLLYVVNAGGQLHSWTSGSPPVLVDDNSPVYRDVHGVDSARLFIGGQEAGGNQQPWIETYTGGPDTSPMTVPGAHRTSIRSVWMVSSSLAYAVGEGNNVVAWGGANWAAITPPAVVDFTGVCAPDRSSVYVTDAVGVIRRYTGIAGSAWQTLYTALPAGELRDIALVTPSSIWAVGPGGRVIHFPELP